MTDVLELSQRIIDGYRIKRGDDLSFFLTADLEKLEAGAGKIEKIITRDRRSGLRPKAGPVPHP